MGQAKRLITQTTTDRVTGVTGTVKVWLGGDGTLRERVAEMADALPAPGPGDKLSANVICDGCGAAAELDPLRPVLPAGWIAGEADLCPRCGNAN